MALNRNLTIKRTVNAHTLLPRDVADWVHETHKIPFVLAISMYNTPLESCQGYHLMTLYSTERIGVWYHIGTDDWIVAFRGTDIFSTTGYMDLLDDTKILFNCPEQLTLEEEGLLVLESLLEEYTAEDICLVGHSLGGLVALKFSYLYKCCCVTFNAAAPPINPILRGPGPILATSYHICGDLISTHIPTHASKVVRVGDTRTVFGTLYPHHSERFLKRDGVKRYVTPQEENTLFQHWASKFKFSWFKSPIYLIGALWLHFKTRRVARNTPIPP